MAKETRPHPVSLDSPLRGLSKPRPLGALPIHAVDAINDINHLLNAYRCVEDLLMPITHEASQPEITGRQLHALMSVLNDTLDHRIRHAKRLAHRLKKRARHLG